MPPVPVPEAPPADPNEAPRGPGQQWGRSAQGADRGWDAPEGTPAAGTPEPSGAWDAPGRGDQPSWGRPVDPSTSPVPAEEPWGTPVRPRPPQAEGWNAPAEPQGPQEAWGGGPTRSPQDWSAPLEPQPSHESWSAPAEPQPQQEAWNGPAQSQHDWGAPAEPQGPPPGWNDPAGAQPPQESWSAPGTSPQPDWGQADQDRGNPGTSPEAWGTPYAGQPAYAGDTPYPGAAPAPYGGTEPGPYEPGQGEPGPQAGENQSDSYGFLYGGGDRGAPSGPQDPHGMGGPQGPDGPDEPYGHEDDAYDPGPPPPRRRSHRGLVIGLVASVVVLALIGAGAGWYVYTLPQPEEATAEYEAAWEEQDYARLAAVTTGEDAETVMGGIDTGLGVEAVDVEVGTPVTEGGTGSAPYEVTVSLTNADDWGWEGELPLLREDGEWRVEFSPEVAFPGLGEGQVLARTAVWGERGRILAADGTRLDTPDVAGSLQMIVGALGEADEEDAERLGPAYDVGDTVGVSGLQRTYEEHLAGEAATTILMVDAAEAEDLASVEVTEENTVAALDGSDGADITTSIDMGVQNAAANAIIKADDPAGLVAVRPSTGEILAAVNVPGGFNRAFEGQYPPGSAFKIITYSSLLDNGLSVDATMECPKEYDLGGWPFRNAGGAEYGAQTVTEAFATSCNTSLVQEVDQYLNPETLQAGAEQFGMNAPLDIGVPTHEPSFPPVDSSTMMGAQGIGQGQILTSPLHMATVPAAVADGSWRHPVLVTEPAQEDLPGPNPIGNAEALRPMMRAVVTEGTAKDVAFQGEVYGKTGSAEFGTPEEDEELPTHAWMVGYKGDVAFAVVVDGGGGGGSVAGPLAADFTNAL
ncbi:penicillin-binding transpeptidase domain-containing protein [Nocardiopsis terrae]